jgi:hypothetical protein
VDAPLPFSFTPGAVDNQRLFQNAPHAHERRQRSIGVLLHIADLRPIPAQIPGTEPGQVSTLKNHLALGGTIQTQDGLRQTAFAAAALADDSDRLPALQLKAHSVHGAHESGAPEHPAPELKLRAQVVDGEQRVVSRRACCAQRTILELSFHLSVFWNIGMLECWNTVLCSPAFHYSNIPVFPFSSYSQHFTCRPSFVSISGGS